LNSIWLLEPLFFISHSNSGRNTLLALVLVLCFHSLFLAFSCFSAPAVPRSSPWEFSSSFSSPCHPFFPKAPCSCFVFFCPCHVCRCLVGDLPVFCSFVSGFSNLKCKCCPPPWNSFGIGVGLRSVCAHFVLSEVRQTPWVRSFFCFGVLTSVLFPLFCLLSYSTRTSFSLPPPFSRFPVVVLAPNFSCVPSPLFLEARGHFLESLARLWDVPSNLSLVLVFWSLLIATPLFIPPLLAFWLLLRF